MRSYVADYLLPYLTEEEKGQLAKAEGRWPDYPIALVEAAGKRPSALPSQHKLITKLADLPNPVQHRFLDKSPLKNAMLLNIELDVKTPGS